jgi:alpha-amylase
LRGFEGGDLRGITDKINEGYFSDLGINAIWFTPIVEQVHGFVDEGTGKTYGYHGYWAKDWTAIDPNFGTRRRFRMNWSRPPIRWASALFSMWYLTIPVR